MSDPFRSVRLTLLGNAVFSTVCAVTFAAFSGPLERALGLPAAWPLLALAPGLLGFAALLVRVARRPEVRKAEVLAVSAADAAWVAGTALLLCGWPELLSATGGAAALAVAMLVALFGTLQVTSLRRACAIAAPAARTQVRS